MLEGKRGAFYGRKSTKKQEMSIDKQKFYAEQFVKQHSGTFHKWYIDSGVSSRVPLLQREDMAKLLNDAKLGNFDFVVVYSHDRFARSPIEHQEIRKVFKDNSIKVYISKSGDRYDEGDLINQVIDDGYSKLELDNIRTRTKSTLKSLLVKGTWTGGKAPYGYRYDSTEKEFSIMDEEIDNVKVVFQLYQKDLGFSAIATRLNRKDTKKEWRSDHVKNIITNPFYAGYLTYNRRIEGSNNSINENRKDWMMIISNIIPKAIELEEWENCWRIYTEKKIKKVNPKYYTTNYYFQSLLKCKKCDVPMKCKNQKSKGSGKQLYICLDCRFKVEIELIHKLVTKVCKDIATKKAAEIKDKVQQEYHKDKGLYEIALVQKENELMLNETKVNNVQRELSVLSRNNPNDNQDFRKALVIANQNINQETQNIRRDINILQNKIDLIDETLKMEPFWKHWIDDLYEKVSDLKETKKLRRFLVNYIDELVIDEDGKIEMTTKYFEDTFNYEIPLS
ncbi:recombinase family protein [Virgibacillus sp. DJP39]|uniref:recombinase family protein n=1 Tax=Virgibacillus sp. DJP39 TaxID=3409790 RepID=UPI003BB7FE42